MVSRLRGDIGKYQLIMIHIVVRSVHEINFGVKLFEKRYCFDTPDYHLYFRLTFFVFVRFFFKYCSGFVVCLFFLPVITRKCNINSYIIRFLKINRKSLSTLLMVGTRITWKWFESNCSYQARKCSPLNNSKLEKQIYKLENKIATHCFQSRKFTNVVDRIILS